MSVFETVVLSLAGLVLAANARRSKRPLHVVRDFIFLAAMSWASEESAIVMYESYAYSPVWGVFFDRVPAAVIAVWPLVILSARDLSLQIGRGRGRGRVVWVGGLIVLADAALIEPLAVAAGLWSWEADGVFGVPAIGLLGWAYFGALSILTLEGRQTAAAGNPLRGFLWWIVPPVGVHLLLAASWWGVFRWIQGPLAPAAVASFAWILSLLLVTQVVRLKTGRRLERGILLLRLPGAVLVFSLFALIEAPSVLLIGYAAAFAPPYLALMSQQYLRRMQGTVS